MVFWKRCMKKRWYLNSTKTVFQLSRNHLIKVFYERELIGEYFADLFVANKVIVEIKATKNLVSEHEAQLLNYLKATDIEVGLLLNFGPKPQIKRKIFDNYRKESVKI